MNSEISKNLIEQGYAVIENCLDKKLIDDIKKNINEDLIKILKKGELNYTDDLTKNLYESRKIISQYELGVKLAKNLVDKNFVSEIFLSKKVIEELIILLGSDIEYSQNCEVIISDKNVDKNDDYLIKKYHQEFWSGGGIEALQIWVPINLLPGMGTIEIIKKSHTWGHVPHRNREPIDIPKEYETEILNIQEGSMAIMTMLTLHRTIVNTHDQPRIALPVTIRNFYHPNTVNLDLFNFKKLNFSFFSKFRKILGNSHYSPYRTLGQKRTDNLKK